MISERRLWLTADKSAVVGDEDPRAAFLLCGAGCVVPAEYADLVSAEKPKATHAPKAVAKATAKPKTAAKK